MGAASGDCPLCRGTGSADQSDNNTTSAGVQLCPACRGYGYLGVFFFEDPTAATFAPGFRPGKTTVTSEPAKLPSKRNSTFLADLSRKKRGRFG
jgi:hypothetical protein